MYKGIVLDKVQTNTFLSMAAQEGLICEKGKTDGVFGTVTQYTPSLRFARMVLEQFIVAGAVYVDPFTYGCMDGELIENGIILPYKKYEEDILACVNIFQRCVISLYRSDRVNVHPL